MKLPGTVLVPSLLLALTLPLAAHGEGDDDAYGPRDEPVDEFHPAREEAATPAYGGTVIVHLPSLPQNLCYTIENSSYTRWMLYELHEFMVQRDWEHWGFRPVLAESWDTEDTVILTGGRGEGNTNVLYGKVSDDGDHWVVTPISPGNALSEPQRVAKSDVESVERETVFTFHLRQGVKWHDGHTFDARDVLFSWQVYWNKGVDCDSIRSYFQKVVHGELVDDYTVRFFYERQYFKALETLGDMCTLPSHLYNLKDPDHPRHDADATEEAQAKEINENPHNTDWIGLGPYKLTTWSQQYVEGVRFDDYFDPENGGYFDVIRWRHIPNTETGFQAVINGEVDFSYRLTSDHYFGEATQKPEFTDNFYKGYYYTGGFNYSPFNTRKPFFSDVGVRKAITYAFDMDGYRQTIAHGLAKMPTGPQFYFGPAYNHDVERLPYDTDMAEELLAEAGWYDRDGDGIIDKDGVPFEIEFLMTSGNKASELFAQKFQESMSQVGISVELNGLEWASFLEKVYDRKFDITGLAWSVPLESDPEQLWHSKGAPIGVRGSNHVGVADAYVDELIEKGQIELDDEKRYAIWKELHRYLYEDVHAYLYRLAPPRKFAMNDKVRGFQSFKIDPGYSVRRWYYPAGTEGVGELRSTPQR